LLFPDDVGTDVVLGGIPVFKLQTADYPSDVRAQIVESVITQFLNPDREGQIAEPEVRVRQDANLQYTLVLGEKGRFAEEQRYLFTVTYADAAAAKGINDPRLVDVQQVADAWARQLERAIASYRQNKLDEQRGQDPLVFVFSIISALAILLIGYGLWRLSERSLSHAQRWLEVKLGQSWDNWIDIGAVLCRYGLGLAITAATLHSALSSIPVLRTLQRILYFELNRILATAFGMLVQPFPNTELSIASILTFLLLIVLVFTISHYISLALKHRFLTRIGLDLGTQEASSTIFKYALTLLGVLLVLPFSGLNLGSLAVIAGAVGIGIGFGLQNLSNNYISYISILFERPIQIGDLVEVDGLLGTVERISPRATVLRTLDRVFVIVPNSSFTEKKVVNWSYRDPRCRIHIPVGVAYRSDPEQVTEALLQAAKENARVLSSPAPQVWLRSFGGSSLNFELLVWINRPQDQFVLVSELNFLIHTELHRRGIEIPFPQQDVHIRSAEGLVGLSHSQGLLASRLLPQLGEDLDESGKAASASVETAEPPRSGSTSGSSGSTTREEIPQPSQTHAAT
jgi:small-conductance mechanosensitive channel